MCYTGPSQPNSSKKAETRANNTKKEVQFLAGAYHDCACFVINSGFSDIGLVNQQFDSMLTNYINAGKIKKESYNKFKALFNSGGMTHLSESKESFVSAIMQLLEDSNVDTTLVDNLQKDFNAMLSKHGIKVDELMKNALYLQLVGGIAELYRDQDLQKTVEMKARKCGLSSVRFTGPQICTYSDGCSGRRYGSLFTNREMLGKYS